MFDGVLNTSLRTVRSSHQRCSLTKGVLGNFAKFTGKHLCQSLFFNKVAGWLMNVPCYTVLKHLKIFSHETLAWNGLSRYKMHWLVDKKYIDQLKWKIREAYSKPCKTSKIERFEKTVNWHLAVDYFRKTPHLRCLTEFWICLWWSYNKYLLQINLIKNKIICTT